MGKERIRQKRREYLLQLQVEENSKKDPGILSMTMMAKSQMEAYIMVGHYLDISNMEPPFEKWGLTADSWRKSLKPPVELYFLFKRKKDLGRFTRKISRELPEVEVIG